MKTLIIYPYCTVTLTSQNYLISSRFDTKKLELDAEGMTECKERS